MISTTETRLIKLNNRKPTTLTSHNQGLLHLFVKVQTLRSIPDLIFN